MRWQQTRQTQVPPILASLVTLSEFRQHLHNENPMIVEDEIQLFLNQLVASNYAALIQSSSSQSEIQRVFFSPSLFLSSTQTTESNDIQSTFIVRTEVCSKRIGKGSCRKDRLWHPQVTCCVRASESKDCSRRRKDWNVSSLVFFLWVLCISFLLFLLK
jgi:hypothetical protein